MNSGDEQMSHEQENTMSTVAAVGVAIFLVLIILVLPAGFGYFYFVRTQYQRAVMAERLARADAEQARARQLAVSENLANQLAQNATRDVQLLVHSDGQMKLDGTIVDLEQLGSE